MTINNLLKIVKGIISKQLTGRLINSRINEGDEIQAILLGK